MNTREKVLIGLMALAIGYGLFHLLRPDPPRGVEEQTSEHAREEAMQFATESRERLERVALGAAQQHAESRIAMAWSGNPFAERSTAVPLETRATQPVKYSGYLNVDAKPFALIDGHAYQPGEFLKDSPYRVSSITAEQVVLDSMDGNKSLTVKIEEDSTRRRE